MGLYDPHTCLKGSDSAIKEDEKSFDDFRIVHIGEWWSEYRNSVRWEASFVVVASTGGFDRSLMAMKIVFMLEDFNWLSIRSETAYKSMAFVQSNSLM